MHKNPMTPERMRAIATKLWPDATGEPINLGRRWVGMLALNFVDGTWRCLVATPGEDGHTEEPRLERRAVNLSAARTYMHLLGRAVFEGTLPQGCDKVGLNIQGIEVLSTP